MALIGNLESFDPAKSDITTYMERFEQLVVCNEVEARKKVSLLLTLIGSQAYSVLKDLLSPEPVTSKSFEQIRDILLKHYAPKRLVIAERYKFNIAQQENGENITAYAARLKNLAKFCEFGSFLNDALRDKLVCGIKSEHIKRKLLTESRVTFESAFQIACGMESAESQLKAMGPEPVINKFEKSNKNVTKNTSKKSVSKCFRCQRNHNPKSCPAREWECYTCHEKGHTSRVCKKKKVNRLQEDNSDANSAEEEDEDSFELGYIANLNNVKDEKPVKMTMKVEGMDVAFEIDTGACKTVLHKADYIQFLSHLRIKPVTYKLKVVTGSSVKILGEVSVKVDFQNKSYVLPVVILNAECKFSPLLGRNWLNIVKPNWSNIFNVCNMSVMSKSNNVIESQSVSEFVKVIKEKFKDVFEEKKHSYIKDFKVDLHVKEGAKPMFHRAYDMPFALREKVESEILNLVEAKVLSKVQHSNWASPIVVVPKKNSNDIRICVDFKKTLNKVIEADHCSLPLPEDIFACLSNKKYFSVIDLKGAYQQLLVNDSSKELLTINTHMGLFCYNRLTYGISSAPGIFQNFMDTILKGLKNTSCYLDDILVADDTLQGCYQKVIDLFEVLSKYNIKVNEKKCKFFKKSVEFLGHIIDRNGIHPTQEKIECIQKARVPENVTQLKSYLGLLNYYGKFIPMLSSKLKPLYNLCKSNIEIKKSWTQECTKAFEESKNFLTSEQVLTCYDPKQPITITCDASNYGVGSVLSHVINGVERPVLYASSTLSLAEQKYSNLEREALAIIFGLKKFHKYIFGREFTLITDHQPLEVIFGKNKGLPITASARITRWAIMLSGYTYKINYKKGKSIGNADGLSRLPNNEETGITDFLFSFNLINCMPLNASDIVNASSKDITLSKVIEHTRSGWERVNVLDEHLKQYFKRRNELSVERNCLLIGSRVVIPKTLQLEVLKLFHEEHIGIVRTKALMRSYCWWPKMNESIEKFIGNCRICQENQNFTQTNPLVGWPKVQKNFFRVHIDFFYKNGFVFLILVDSKSKWIEVKLMENSTNAKETILKLKSIFSVFGIPNELVSDNGPPFNSTEFTAFCQANGIKPVKSPPYHPQSNGAAERSVQTVKKALSKSLFLEKSENISKYMLETRIHNFLFIYRNTPSTVTGMSPAESLLKNRPRTRFDLLKPCNIDVTVKTKNNNVKTTLFKVNDTVYVKNVQKKIWEEGKIIKIISFCMYLVQVQSVLKYVHADCLRLRVEVDNTLSTESVSSSCFSEELVQNSQIQPCIEYKNTSDNSECKDPDPVIIPQQETILPKIVNSKNSVIVTDPSTSPEKIKTKSGRIVKPPCRMNL